MGDTRILAIGGLGLKCSLKSICKIFASVSLSLSWSPVGHSPLVLSTTGKNPAFSLASVLEVLSQQAKRCLLRGPGIGRPSIEHGILGC